MLKNYLSLSHFERILLTVGLLSLAAALMNILIEKLDRVDRGVRRHSSSTMKNIIFMSGISLFSLLTLFLISKGVAWYMAYPASVLVTLLYALLAVVFFGTPKKPKFPQRDNRVTIGHIGLVYKTVYPNDSRGCVSVDVFGSTFDSFAISATDEEIPIGTRVKVIDTDGDLLVCSAEKEKKEDKK